MHELSLCQAVLRLVEPIARQHAAPVTRVVLRVGALSGAEPALLLRAFPLAAAGSCAEGADLLIEHSPIRVRCLECGVESGASINRLTCPACGAIRTQVIGGDELDLLRVELQTDEAKEAYV